jgi:antirestriction protein ArdC
MTPIGQAEAFVAAMGTQIAHGGTRAFYRASTDSIQLTPREAFIGSPPSTPAESYYSTLLHELTHWTSAESRCNRQLGKRFGDDAYAMEGLVAELGRSTSAPTSGSPTNPAPTTRNISPPGSPS